MLVGEFTQRVQSDYSKGPRSKDSRLSDRMIYSVGMTSRSVLIERKSNKKQDIDINTYQVLPCVELEMVGSILRSKYKIPKIVTAIKGLLINSISNEYGSTIYSRAEFKTQKYQSGNKFTGQQSKIIVDNGRLIITNHNQLLKFVRVSAIFVNPIEAYSEKFQCEVCPDCCKSNYEYDFHLDSGLEDAAVKMTLDELLRIFRTGSHDKANNATDDVNTGKVGQQTQNEQDNG